MSQYKLVDSGKWKLKFGSLSIYEIANSSGKWREGSYRHPLGIVEVMCSDDYCRIDACSGGIHYMEARGDNPSDKQIAYFCRQLLLKIHSPNPVQI